MSNTTSTRIIVITFNNQIQPWEVSKFRGAIIEKVGREHDIFHNHNNEHNESEAGYYYRYPLIQYRYHKGNPQLICIQHGIEEIQQLFSKPDWVIQIGERTEKLRIKDLSLKNIEVKTVDYQCNYQLQHWLPFNAKNYMQYNALEYEIERIQFLEQILTGHILAFAEGVGWKIEEKLNVRIKRIVKEKKVPFKRTKALAINLDFSVNATLPFQAGLGKGVARGFGLLNMPTNLIKKGRSKQRQAN